MNENEQLSQFAENLWKNYLSQKNEQKLASCVRFYRAQVTANQGNGKLTVQRAFDEPVTVNCTSGMEGASVGDQVTVLVFGRNIAKNSVVVSDGAMHELGGRNEKRLLWSGASAVTANTVISVDLSDYDEVEIIYSTGITTYSATSCASVTIPVGMVGYGYAYANIVNSSQAIIAQKPFTVSASGVTTGTCTYKRSSAWTTPVTSSPNGMSPLRIYGIKTAKTE